MAPSETETQKGTEWQFPLSIERYPYAVSDEVQLGNQLIKTVNIIDSFADDLEELAEYAKMFAMLSEEDESDRLNIKFREVVEEVTNNLEEFEQATSEVRDIPLPNEHQGQAPQEAYQNLSSISHDVQTAVADHRDISVRVKEQRKIAQSDIVDLNMASDELERVAEQYINASEEVIQFLLRTIKEKTATLSGKCSQAVVNQPNNCPVCGEELHQKNLENVAGQYQLTLARCEDCQTEWGLTETNMEVIHSQYDMQGLKLVTKVVEEACKEGYRLPEDVTEYRRLSKEYNKAGNKIVGGAVLLGLGIMGISYAAGSLVLFVLLAIGLLIASKLIGDYYLQKTIEKEMAKIATQQPS